MRKRGPIFRSRTSTLLLMLLLLLTACSSQINSTLPTRDQQQAALSSTKQYLQGKSVHFNVVATTLQTAINNYYSIAKAKNFDYGQVASVQGAAVREQLNNARTAWLQARSTYIQMQGITGQILPFQQYDIDLASGISQVERSELVEQNETGIFPPAVSFDLHLSDGRVLPKPGSLFTILAQALWDLQPSYATSVSFDYMLGQHDIGTVLPEVSVLKSAADMFRQAASDLDSAIKLWQPTLPAIFSAFSRDLISINDLFGIWQSALLNLPAGNNSNNSEANESGNHGFDAAVRSYLSDITDAISGWQSIYQALSPLVASTSLIQDRTISQGLNSLESSIFDIYMQKQGGKQFTRQETDLLRSKTVISTNNIHDQLIKATTVLKVPLEQ